MNVVCRAASTFTLSCITIINFMATQAYAVDDSAQAMVNAAPMKTETSESAATPSDWDVNYQSAGNKPGSASTLSLLREGPIGGIWQRAQLLGDMGGLRSYLGGYGISLNLQETSEVFGNTTGGIKQSAAYDGLTTMGVALDTQRAFNWRGGIFNVSALQVHGSNLSASNLANLQTASGIEADNGFRLWELWYQQSFYYNKVDVKIGQQSLDQEFMVSQYANLFANTMFGWAMLPSADLLGGGPAYPLSSLGARVRVQPGGPITFLAGVFDDNPGGSCAGGDAQVCDRRGTNFRLNDDPLVMMELQYSRPAPGEMEYAGSSPILPGTYKLGFWYDAGKFTDQQYGTDGLSLANSASNGNAQLHRGNYSLYAVADQLVWRESPESEEGVGVFFRGMIAPTDRNLIDLSINAGITYREPFEHREDDVFGIGVGYANVSSSASALDRDTGTFTGTAYPIRGGETFIEATYQYQVVPWWQLQPDFQYVLHPGGGIPNPDNANARIGDEAIIGLRTNITF